MGRTFESVTAFAFDRSSTGATYTLSTPSLGAIQPMRLPSWLMRGPVRSGLPKMSWRGKSDASARALGTAGAVAAASADGALAPSTDDAAAGDAAGGEPPPQASTSADNPANLAA